MIIVALLMFLFLNSTAHAWDIVYQCQDGTFTNRPQLGCPKYTSPPPSDDSAVQLSVTPGPTQTAARELIEDSAIRCTVYHEWLDLDRRTSGGRVFSTIADERRWKTLALIYRYWGIPRCGQQSFYQSTRRKG